jgi:CheY-like chemotaxis protein
MSRVLIFDDDLDILELCTIILKANGFEVTAKPTCQDVLQVVNESSPDVILMDNWIPDIGGIRATQLIKATPATKDIPVIFFSANNNTEKHSIEAGAEYFIQKPFEIWELVGKVNEAISHGN